MEQTRQIPHIAYHGDELVIEGEHTPEQLSVARQVGYQQHCHTGVFDALKCIERVLPPGWSADYGKAPLAPLALRVGQVKVRPSDSAYPLYVYPTRDEADIQRARRIAVYRAEHERLTQRIAELEHLIEHA